MQASMTAIFPCLLLLFLACFVIVVDAQIIETVKAPELWIISDGQERLNRRRRVETVAELQHTDSIQLRFTAFQTNYVLHLKPNTDIFHPRATTRIFGGSENDAYDIVEPLDPRDYRIYKGYVVGEEEDNWARIMIRHDQHEPVVFEGAFGMGSNLYHIKTRTNFHLTKRAEEPVLNNSDAMVIYRDDNHDDYMCAMEEMLYNQKLTGIRPFNNSTVAKRMWKRTINDQGGRGGCPSVRKIAYMGAAADCSYVQAYGSIRYARLQIINDWNMASAVYERTFNISLGLIYIHMSLPDCPRRQRSTLTRWNQGCSSFYTINDRLSDFSLWRGSRGDDGAALWHLMTNCSTGVKVGIAWLSQLCETQVSQQIEENGSSEWVSGTGVSSITRDEWKVVAHEIGHGFGAIHDCTALTCPCSPSGCSCCPLSDTICSAGYTYLMNPTSNVTTEDFSPCSISDICGSFPNIGYCLQTPEMRNTNSFAMCGNGILEPGEECDPGQTDSACCYAKTCRLKPGAVCDDYSYACCLNCTVAPSSTVCRPAVSECDIPEYCTGQSFECPPDQYETNGSLCANGTLQCASGVCTSRDEQCMASGLRLSVTQDCPFQKDSCQVSCADPTDPGNCLLLSGVFLDGTECGLAGFCEKGVCVGTGPLNTLKAWVAQNPQIAIPVFLFGSLIILGCMAWLTWFIIISRRRRNRLAVAKDKDSRPSSINNDVYQLGSLSGDDANHETGENHAVTKQEQASQQQGKKEEEEEQQGWRLSSHHRSESSSVVPGTNAHRRAKSNA